MEKLKCSIQQNLNSYLLSSGMCNQLTETICKFKEDIKNNVRKEFEAFNFPIAFDIFVLNQIPGIGN